MSSSCCLFYILTDSWSSKTRIQSLWCGTEHLADSVFTPFSVETRTKSFINFHSKRSVEGAFYFDFCWKQNQILPVHIMQCHVLIIYFYVLQMELSSFDNIVIFGVEQMVINTLCFHLKRTFFHIYIVIFSWCPWFSFYWGIGWTMKTRWIF